MKWRASYLKGMESLQRKASFYRGGGNLDSEVFRFKEEWFRKYWLCCCLVEFCCNDLNNYNCTDLVQKQGVCTGVCWGGEAEVEAEIAAQLFRELVEHTSVDEIGWEEWICPLVSLLPLLLLLSRFSRVQLCATPEMAAHQAPPSLGFSRQEHWSGLPFPSPMHESEKWKGSRSVVSDS